MQIVGLFKPDVTRTPVLACESQERQTAHEQRRQTGAPNVASGEKPGKSRTGCLTAQTKQNTKKGKQCGWVKRERKIGCAREDVARRRIEANGSALSPASSCSPGGFAEAQAVNWKLAPFFRLAPTAAPILFPQQLQRLRVYTRKVVFPSH
jgi:hypothetical protein